MFDLCEFKFSHSSSRVDFCRILNDKLDISWRFLQEYDFYLLITRLVKFKEDAYSKTCRQFAALENIRAPGLQWVHSTHVYSCNWFLEGATAMWQTSVLMEHLLIAQVKGVALERLFMRVLSRHMMASMARLTLQCGVVYRGGEGKQRKQNSAWPS